MTVRPASCLWKGACPSALDDQMGWWRPGMLEGGGGKFKAAQRGEKSTSPESEDRGWEKQLNPQTLGPKLAGLPPPRPYTHSLHALAFPGRTLGKVGSIPSLEPKPGDKGRVS